MRHVMNTMGQQYTPQATIDIGINNGHKNIPTKRPKTPNFLKGHRQFDITKPRAFNIDRLSMSLNELMMANTDWPHCHSHLHPIAGQPASIHALIIVSKKNIIVHIHFSLLIIDRLGYQI